LVASPEPVKSPARVFAPLRYIHVTPLVAPPPEPLMAAVAVLGVLRVAPPVGLVIATLKVLLPEKAAALLTGTEKVFAAALPSAHCRVPLAGV